VRDLRMQHGNKNSDGYREVSIELLEMTRQEAQMKSNDDYVFGRITKEEWSKQFDEFSDVRTWTKEGKIEKTKEKDE
jgi:hypothetical protein